MKQTRLDEIKARCDKATARPWHTEKVKSHYEVWGAPDGQYDGTEYTQVCKNFSNTDADFIAHSREDVPELLAEVERQNTNIDALAKCISVKSSEVERLTAENSKLQQQNVALKSEQDELKAYKARSEEIVKQTLDKFDVIESESKTLIIGRDVAVRALEMALQPRYEHDCPSKNFKIAVECKNGWVMDKEKCCKCWTDYYIQQAKKEEQK